MSFAFAFAFSSLIVLFAASVTGQDYLIRMHKPLKAGQRYQLSVVGSESNQQSMLSGPESAKRQMENLSVDMESVVTVLAVNANGLPTKESHTIVKLLHGAKKEPLLPPGTTVTTWLNGQSTLFHLGERLASETESRHLTLAAALASDGPTDDTVYGTWERKKPGDSWPVNTTLGTRYLNETLASLGLKVATFEGKTTFQKVTQDAGTNVFHMGIYLKATAKPVVKAPRGSARATIECVFNAACPADITKSAREDALKQTISFIAFSPPDSDGVTKQLSTKTTRSITRKFKMLEQAPPAPAKPAKTGR
jgi:hypothetical protein